MSIYAKYLVCYDVSSNSRRKKFSDALKDLVFSKNGTLQIATKTL